ncbi:MAG TPA: sialidase family protein [Thermoanaerobaculia bacterium]
MPRSSRSKIVLMAALAAVAFASVSRAQLVDNRRGVDRSVDYSQLAKYGPWDDRNYKLTRGDLAWFAPNEEQLKDPIPAFFRVELRKGHPDMLRSGPAQYPRSALQIFYQEYGGYLVSGKLYRNVNFRNGRFVVVRERGITPEEFAQQKALTSDVRVTSPEGAAESAVKIHPTDVNKVIAGSNGPGSGQKMHYSTNGGSTWTPAAALPGGGTCCDPTVDWSSDGSFAYAATLGSCTARGCGVWFYRSNDGGQTWNGLEAVTPGTPRREITKRGSDKEYLHVDKFATSPFKDNLYLTWHDSNILKFSRSTNFGNTWSAPLTISGTGENGIGSDIVTDKSGNVYYFWPAFNAKKIFVKKSTNGGSSFAASVTVGTTQDGYDFAIPAMETRRAFIYVAADADLTTGAFANSIYAAWTDTTAPESGTPANNHGRIQVAYSRDGGASWTVTTPHETADANTVDRFHPWLAVGPDGRVYVIFYDTRRDPTRVAVDIFYSVSSDGAQTWSAPARLTSVISPQIDTSFEWGDYNGLDVIGTQLIGIFTDNRNEGGGAADSVDVYGAGLNPPL